MATNIYGNQFNQNAPHTIGQIVNNTDRPGDPFQGIVDSDLRAFLTGTAEGIASLRLPETALAQAEATLHAAGTEAQRTDPDNSRLRQLGISLREVVESAASQTLSSMLLGLWHP